LASDQRLGQGIRQGMTKPILWLGPLEEIDSEFDPLLGRSAKDLVAQATNSHASRLTPDRSVFDDAEPVAAFPEAPLPEAPAGFAEPPADPFALEGQPSTDAPQADPEVVAAEDIEPLPHYSRPEVEAQAPIGIADDAPMDYAHNNEAIPTGQPILPQVTEAAQPQDFEPDFALDDVAEPETKSFFTRLFTRKPAAPAADYGGASINDIWAKSEPEVIDPPEPEVLPEVLPEPELQERELPEPELVEPEPAESEPALIPDELTAIEAPPLPSEPEIEVEDVETSAETEQPGIVEADAPIELDEEPSIVEAAVPAEPEGPVVEHEAAPTQADPLELPAQATAEHRFSRAFNANRFWTIGTEEQRAQIAEANEAAPVTAEPDPTFVDQAELVSEPQVIADEVPVAPVLVGDDDRPINAPKRSRAPGQRRKRKPKKNYVGAFFGTFIFGVVAIMTLVSSVAPLGYPFDLVSSYRWYWVTLGVVAAAIWGFSRGWKMVLASFAVIAANLIVTMPASGDAPVGGKTATAVVGWANVAGAPDALARVFKDADNKKATLLMVAETPTSLATPPAGWSLIEAPVPNDPTAIAVFSKGSWRAVTVPGEPTMARPPAGDLTIIGVHPHDAQKGRRRTPKRDELINRAGTRAGIQDGPTVVLGDFNAAPWDGAMKQFRNYGNVERVRCGGWTGSTVSQTFGLIGVATDHAYVRDVKVTHCKLGAPLAGGNHKPIWLYVAPQAPAPVEPQP
jgi:hypothetical protein